MRELQTQLEIQIQNEIKMATDFKEKIAATKSSIDVNDQYHNLRTELSDLFSAKEELERLTESLIKKVIVSEETSFQSIADSGNKTNILNSFCVCRFRKTQLNVPQQETAVGLRCNKVGVL